MERHYNAERNRHIGPAGMACMHGDAQSSDCSPVPGPGAGPWEVKSTDLGGACPTVVVGSDGLVQVLVTQRFGKKLTFLQPKVMVLDPADGSVLSELEIPKGSILGGVYAFIDNDDRMVLVDGQGTLLRVAHNTEGTKLYIDERMMVDGFVGDDPAMSLVPTFDGKLWVVTVGGRVGLIDVTNHVVNTVALREFAPDEKVDNSISAAPHGCAVTTTHGLYVVRDDNGTPVIAWAQPYDRGVARKPGKLTYGSGASPTFFGPTGSEYLTITDNAQEQENLLVFDAHTGEPKGKAGIFTPGASGTECSAIGIGQSIVVASTYGYPYPRVPDHAGDSQPASAPMVPGLERWDVVDEALKNVWKVEDSYNAVVPRLSTADGLIYMCERPKGGPRIDAVIRDMESGEEVYRQTLPGLVTLFGVDTLQMVGTIDPQGTWWQGTIGGIVRIARKGDK